MVDELGTLDEVVAAKWRLKSYDVSPSRPQFPLVGALLEGAQGWSIATASQAPRLEMICTIPG